MRVVVPGGVYAQASAGTQTLGTASLAIEGLGQATLSFAAGVEGLTLTNGTDIVPGTTTKNLTITTANTTVGNTAHNISNPNFVSGALDNNSSVEGVLAQGSWATFFKATGVPQLTYRDCMASIPGSNTTSTGFAISGASASGISTQYTIDNCSVVGGGAIALKLGADIQGIILDNFVSFGQQIGIEYVNPTSSDLFQVGSGTSVGANQALLLNGAPGAVINNLQLNSVYLYGPGSTTLPFVQINYVTSGTVTGCVIDPVQLGTLEIKNSNALVFSGNQFSGTTMILTGSNGLQFNGGQLSITAIVGAASNTNYNGVTFLEKVTFTNSFGATDNPNICGCDFLLNPDLTALTAPNLFCNWFQGVFYLVGAPASALASGYVPGYRKPVAATSVITVTASPFQYSSPGNGFVLVNASGAGTLTSVTLTRNAVQTNILGNSNTVLVPCGLMDVITVGYSGIAPTMTFIPS